MSKPESVKGGAGYTVGYRKPPKSTQFKKGQSGNPQGRPKGGVNVGTLLRRALMENITVTVDGRPRRMSKMNAALIQLANKAVKGDAKAMQQVLDLMPLVEGSAAVNGTALQADADKEVLAGILGRLNAEPADTPTATTQPKVAEEGDE